MGISGATRLAAVLGDPARHSLSPALHNAAFTERGLDWVYLAFDVAPEGLEGAFGAMRSMNIGGYSITMPHKARVLDFVDEVSPEVRTLAAANCVVNRDGVLIAHNTDGDGFVNGLVNDTGFEVAGRKATVLGAGGAARAVIDALVRHGAAEVVVVNRSIENAETAALVGGAVARAGTASDIATSDLVVNATPLGMGSSESSAEGPLPCDPTLLGSSHVVVDLIYSPSVTAWMKAATRNGAVVANGLSMLVFQAATQFTLWTGEPAPTAQMFAAVKQSIQS